MDLGHCRNYDDSYETAKDDEKQADVVQEREESIPEYDNGTTQPSDEDEGDIDMPCFDRQIGMKDEIHLYCHVGRDRDYRSEVKNPAKEVQCPGKEANRSAPSGSRRDGSPVVDATRRWYAGSELVGVNADSTNNPSLRPITYLCN